MMQVRIASESGDDRIRTKYEIAVNQRKRVWDSMTKKNIEALSELSYKTTTRHKPVLPINRAASFKLRRDEHIRKGPNLKVAWMKPLKPDTTLKSEEKLTSTQRMDWGKRSVCTDESIAPNIKCKLIDSNPMKIQDSKKNNHVTMNL